MGTDLLADAIPLLFEAGDFGQQAGAATLQLGEGQLQQAGGGGRRPSRSVRGMGRAPGLVQRRRYCRVRAGDTGLLAGPRRVLGAVNAFGEGARGGVAIGVGGHGAGVGARWARCRSSCSLRTVGSNSTGSK